MDDWEVGEPIPAGYRTDTRPRRGLIIAGAVLFGSLYAVSDVLAYASVNPCSECGGDPNGAALFVPLAGPFLYMGLTKLTAVSNVILALDGLGQAAGVAMFVAGFAAPTSVLVRDDAGFMVKVEPVTYARNGAGLRLVGTF